MNLLAAAGQRYTTKAYDASRRVAPELIEELLELLRLAPSSVNSQPWHFVLASDEAGRARIAKSACGAFASNHAKLVNASHIIAICAQIDLTEADLAKRLEQEALDGRFKDDAARAMQEGVRNSFLNLHKTLGDVPQWLEKQAYLALGTLLLGAGALGVDATPIEGFDREVLNAELGLTEKGLTGVVLVSLGYRAADDFNAALPKSRLPADEVITRL